MRQVQSYTSDIPALLLSPSDAVLENLELPATPFHIPRFGYSLVTAASQISGFRH
jgi:hypothetical protein